MEFYQRFRLPFSSLMALVMAVGAITSLFCAHQPRADGRNYIRVNTDREVYAVGQPVKITPVLVNQSGDSVSYTMAYVAKIFDAEETPILEREMVAYGKMTIPPHDEGRLDEFTWDQRDKDRNQISQGQYLVFIRLFEYRYRDIGGHKWIAVR